MMKYNFILKDNNDRSYRQFIWFLFFLHVIAAGVFVLNTNNDRVKIELSILLGFYVILGISYNYFKKHSKALETFSLVMALLYANFWFKQAGFIALIIFAAIYILVTMVKGKKTTVLFSNEGVHLTRVFKTAVFPWTEMDNVVLKDNLLTIDFKTNKIIQVEIAEPNKAVDEQEFNLFCAGLIEGED